MRAFIGILMGLVMLTILGYMAYLVLSILLLIETLP